MSDETVLAAAEALRIEAGGETLTTTGYCVEWWRIDGSWLTVGGIYGTEAEASDYLNANRGVGERARIVKVTTRVSREVVS